MLELKLIHVSERGPWSLRLNVFNHDYCNIFQVYSSQSFDPILTKLTHEYKILKNYKFLLCNLR